MRNEMHKISKINLLLLILPIILLTGHAEVSTAVRSLKEGAFDFIEKPFSDQVLLDSIQAAIRTDRTVRT